MPRKFSMPSLETENPGQQTPPIPEEPWSSDMSQRQSVGSLALENLDCDRRLIERTTSYVGPNGFELTTTDTLREGIKHHGFGKTRRQFADLIEAIYLDPFGSTSIDAFGHTISGQTARLVHKVTGPLQDLVPGVELAIKGTGLSVEENNIFGIYRSKLRDQFRGTLKAQRAQDSRAPDGIGGCLFINKVFGVLTYRAGDSLQEWMIMENVVGGRPVDDLRPTITSGRAFDTIDYPELARIAGYPESMLASRRWDVVYFDKLRDSLTKTLQVSPTLFNDLNGNNLLEQSTPHGPRYTVIDLLSLDPKKY